MGKTVIVQASNDIPILQLGGHYQNIGGFTLTYFNTQSASLGATADTGGVGSNGIEWWWPYNGNYHDIAISNAARCGLTPAAGASA